MRNVIVSMWLAFALLLFTSTAARAAPGVALVIGNAAYRTEGMALANPVADARILGAKLAARGFEVAYALDADLAGMRAALAAFRAAAVSTFDPQRSHFVYYSGHAVQLAGVNYLLPVDAAIGDEAAVRASSLPLPEVLSAIAILRTQVNFVVLDACRGNPFAAGEQANGLAPVAGLDNAFIAFAAAPGADAYDGDGRNSRFTAALAMALSDETASAQDVFRRARDYVITATEGRQRPDYVDTIRLAGLDPWQNRSIGAPRIGQTRALIVADETPLARSRYAAASLRTRPAPSPDADLAGYIAALKAMLDVGAQSADVAPDYMDETYGPMLRRVLTAAASERWSAYDLALFLAHAAQETYQFQAVAEYGSDAYFTRYDGRFGNANPGDGARYRGRGLLQLRGRAAYREAGAMVGVDLEADPDAVARDANLSARVAVVQFRAMRRALTGAPQDDLVATTRILTGAQRDVGLRGHYFWKMLQALQRSTSP